jgi:hypothetical protein
MIDKEERLQETPKNMHGWTPSNYSFQINIWTTCNGFTSTISTKLEENLGTMQRTTILVEHMVDPVQ